MRPDPKMLRRMGLLKDQEGIMRRYLREAGSWDSHLERSRSFILDSFPVSPPESDGAKSVSLAILGSGWLLDIPLEALRLRFDTIYLADLHHPPQVRKKIKAMDGVIPVATDLSGGALARVREFARNDKMSEDQFLAELDFADPMQKIHYTNIASVNLLSQLDGLLAEHIEKTRRTSPGFLRAFREKIQGNHLAWITKTPGCLITDTIEHYSDRRGMKKSRDVVLVELPAGAAKEAWSWDFDLDGNYRSGMQTTMEVRAVRWD